jgi:hypothetical protein
MILAIHNVSLNVNPRTDLEVASLRVLPMQALSPEAGVRRFSVRRPASVLRPAAAIPAAWFESGTQLSGFLKT